MTKEQFERATEIDNEIYRINYRTKENVELLIGRINCEPVLSEEARKKIVDMIASDTNIDGRIAELQKEFDAL